MMAAGDVHVRERMCGACRTKLMRRIGRCQGPVLVNNCLNWDLRDGRGRPRGTCVGASGCLNCDYWDYEDGL